MGAYTTPSKCARSNCRSDARMTISRFNPRWVLAGTIILAVLVRLISAVMQGDTVVELPGIQDQISYDALAQRVLGGYGFSFGSYWWPATHAGEPTAHWSFLYTLYLAGIYAIF